MKTSRRRRLFILGAWPLAMAAAGLRAGPAPGRVRVEGQWFDTVVRVAGAELRLNGTGVRAVAWFKGYAAGLYLASPISTAAQALALAGPKRLQLRMLQEVPAGEFVKALNKGVARNASPAELAALERRLVQFDELIAGLGKVHVGDVVDLDHAPGRGLLMQVNGTLRGDALPGDDMFAAVLRAFVGDHPYDEKLKAGLLGQPA
jgi:hypothetical protein